jgi:hypothetical protein
MLRLNLSAKILIPIDVLVAAVRRFTRKAAE